MRLRSIRYKDGRAPVHVIHNAKQVPEDNLHGTIRQHAQAISDMSEPGSTLDGFVMIGVYSDGKASVGFRFPQSIPRTLLVAYLSEIIRRDVLIDNEARDVFDSMFHWNDGR